MGVACSIDIGHLVKTILLGLGTNTFDVFSDVGNGLYHYNPKNVTRYFGNSTMVPDHCFPHEDHNVTKMFDCAERDFNWAMMTFAFIQLPGLVLALCSALGTLSLNCSSYFGESESFGVTRMLLFSVLSLLMPFPLLVTVQQLASLFITGPQMTLFSAVFLFGEGSLEASPQLLLLVYVILSDSEREVAWIQIVSIVSSVVTISKTSIELFLNESYCSSIYPQEVFEHDNTNDDSMIEPPEGRSVLEKLKLIAVFSPAFLSSLVFKVRSCPTSFTFHCTISS